jgi:hypothetical protein
VVQEDKICVRNLKMTTDLRQEIGTVQKQDAEFQKFKDRMLSKGGSDFRENDQGILYFRERICVPNVGPLRKQILEEAHQSRYTIYPSEVKMYKDLKRVYWWSGMKKDVPDFVSTCLTCQKVKADHKKTNGLL